MQQQPNRILASDMKACGHLVHTYNYQAKVWGIPNDNKGHVEDKETFAEPKTDTLAFYS